MPRPTATQPLRPPPSRGVCAPWRAVVRAVLCLGALVLLVPARAAHAEPPAADGRGIRVAQLFSPGKLATPHAHLEGLKNCLECHSEGEKVDDNKCLDCHAVIQTRRKARQGYHHTVRAQSCAKCHGEHKGRAHNLRAFERGERRFLHVKTGFALKGAHKKANCRACHENRRVADADVRALLKKHDKTHTFLGLPSLCADCHFDEHRGQFSRTGERTAGRTKRVDSAGRARCNTCHSETAFDPARGFDHDDARFKLEFKHADVACKDCHAPEAAPAVPKTALLQPMHTEMIRYRPIEHTRCTDCHEDVHHGDYGARCTDCHSPRGWHVFPAHMPRGFHARTAFPLNGAHQTVACRACHGPSREKPRLTFKPVLHDRCDACHADAHVGQISPRQRMAASGPAKNNARDSLADCATCHTEDSFTTFNFADDAHGRARFALNGAHRAVRCGACHTPGGPVATVGPNAADAAADEARVSAALATLKTGQRRVGRKVLASAAVLAWPSADPAACTTCHADPHDGKMRDAQDRVRCASCHKVTGFIPAKFDHDTTAFPLKGAHQTVDCDRCHERTADGTLVESPLSTACASCHTDAHHGQFTPPSGAPVDCARCHNNTAFDDVDFDHDTTRFALTGAHTRAKCTDCHIPVVLGEGPDGAVTAARYRPTPLKCGACHKDPHAGRFDAYAPVDTPPSRTAEVP